MTNAGGRTPKRLALEILGWVLLLAGIAMIALPGPGLLGLFAGLALLSQQYEWAERRVEPVRLRALKSAAEGVETWPRIVASGLGVVALVALGVYWSLGEPVPSWWPVPADWPLLGSFWTEDGLVGGIWTGVVQIASAFIALALLVYSYRRFHGDPTAVAELDGDIEVADDASDGVMDAVTPDHGGRATSGGER